MLLEEIGKEPMARWNRDPSFHPRGSAEALADVAERLAPYKAPKSLEFLEEIPKNAVGKILRSALVAD